MRIKRDNFRGLRAIGAAISVLTLAACATSAHCIRHAMEQIQMGKQDVIFAGGGEEEKWSQS